jgi:hypothetical protein
MGGDDVLLVGSGVLEDGDDGDGQLDGGMGVGGFEGLMEVAVALPGGALVVDGEDGLCGGGSDDVGNGGDGALGVLVEGVGGVERFVPVVGGGGAVADVVGFEA